MEHNDNDKGLMNKDTQIQLILNQPEDDDSEIDLGRVFHTMKKKFRIFGWVMILFLLVGVCVPLVMYQINRKPSSVTSVVTLRYYISNPQYQELLNRGAEIDPEKTPKEIPVNRLIAPDETELDLSQITASSVLSDAISDLNLSQKLDLDQLRTNITITRVLTEESSRLRETLVGLANAKDNSVYNRLSTAEMEYQPRFIVTLSNGFGASDSRRKAELTDEELRIVLDRILSSYNLYLVETYADVKLPEDEISVIDVENLDILESMDLLETAVDDLRAYCDSKSDNVKSYRSWRTGRTLLDWIDTLDMLKSANVDYLEAFVYASSITKDKDAVKVSYMYQLRNLQNQLTKLEETIQATDESLKNYTNDKVFVSMQDSDSVRSTSAVTAYYNNLVLEQAENYEESTRLRIEIAEIQNKLSRLEAMSGTNDTSEAEKELQYSVRLIQTTYEEITAHMEELIASPIFSTYAEHSNPQGKTVSFITASAKKMLIGGGVGLVLALGLWFLAGLAPEFRHNSAKAQSGKEAAGK